MNILFRIILFMLMFNVAAFMISATGFFPNTIYGDITHYSGASDPTNLATPEQMFNNIILNSNGQAFKLAGVTVTFGALMGSLVLIAIGVGALTRSTVPITLGLLSTMFLFMYSNSKTAFDNVADNLDSMGGYVALMLGLGVLFTIIVVVMDYASGQKNA